MDLVMLWGEAKVLSPFAQIRHTRVHIYKDLSGYMWEHGHGWLVSQCCINVTALLVQWVTVTNHNCQLGAAHKSILFVWQVDVILMPQDPSLSHAVCSSTGRLPEPLLQHGT